MDLTDEQWVLLKPHIPEPLRHEDSRVRLRRDLRDVLNGILRKLLHTCAPRKSLPERYPPYYRELPPGFRARIEESVLPRNLETPTEGLEELA